MSFAYRIGVTTISKIIPEVCDAIWEKLSPIHMKAPDSADEWQSIADEFWKKWQFPNCLGSVDGKHVVMLKPWRSGSRYFNYKGTCSTVLMALVDAKYKFIAIDTGSFGRNSDGGIFSRSALGRRFMNDDFNFPQRQCLPNFEQTGQLPFVAVGDEAFPLLENLLRPYPGRQLSLDRMIFNYRLSRARRVVENAFGILAARWRVYHTKIAVAPIACDKIVKATTVLHNLLQGESSAAETQNLLDMLPNLPNRAGLQPLTAVGNRATKDAVQIRNAFKDFFVQDNSVHWQKTHVRRGCFTES